ncbi:MAG: methyl-accepting chemotaxis protein [Chloroflexota bacterium]
MTLHDYLTENIADSTSLLALVTALLLFVLYALSGNVLLLIAGAFYVVLAGVGIYRHQQAKTNKPKSDRLVDNDEDDTNSQNTIRTITTSMGVTVDGLVRATHAINEVTSQQSSSAKEQVDVIGNANEKLDAFLVLSNEISAQARAIARVSQEAADISETGQQALQQTLESMEDIRKQVEAIGETIVTLAGYTRRIDGIITSVSEIATQSNLLALNASIEAARAGTHGRGFAVVADEVRELASQSTQSAAAVRFILGEIKNAMKDTVEATRTGIENVDAGVDKTQEANQVIVQLTNNVRESRDAVGSIYNVIRQQADGMEEIAIDMDRIQMITNQSLASTRTVESVSANLTRLANDLQTVVSTDTLADVLARVPSSRQLAQ